MAMLAASAGIAGSTTAGDRRLTNDAPRTSGYVSNYTMVTGKSYTDPTLTECSTSRGRENEPAVEIDPRNPNVIVGSSNDYCGVYNAPGTPPPAAGPIWLGYYRSENGGSSFASSLVPGYPGDTSPFASRAQIRTASAGDPVLAWDRQGRLFAGSESSDDPAGTAKTYGDVWVATYENPQGSGGPTSADGKEFTRSVIVEKGTSAPSLLGNFNDKTAIEVDRTGGPCDGNVYFAWSRFSGNGGVSMYFSRSTDHGQTFGSKVDVSTGSHDVQFADISVTGNGHVYVTYRQYSDTAQPDAIMVSRSTNCGATFEPPRVLTLITRNDAVDVAAPQAAPSSPADDSLETEKSQDTTARDCGDFDAACSSGYTFFRRDTQARSTADQNDSAHEYLDVVFDGTRPGTETATGTTYGTDGSGTAGQAAISFIRYDGATASASPAVLVAPAAKGHQVFPDIAVSAGKLHTIWWDSRNDPCYAVTRPIGNCANRSTVASIDAYGSSSTDGGATWAAATRLSDVTSNPNWEQFSNRTVPFAGDYLWVSAVGSKTFAVWTDWRNTVGGSDAREGGDGDHDDADVKQCRTTNTDGSFGGDTCPRAGGLDQDIYGDFAP